MSKVVLDITMSLDGFIAGTTVNPKQPMGEGGLRLHDWIFGAKSERDAQVIDEVVETSGAVVVGRHTYDVAIEEAWEGASPFQVPAFVLSKSIPPTVVKGFTFVTEGPESALTQAKAVAGDRNVWVMGGANIAQQYIKAGLVDELHIHIAPVLFGSGTRLFEHTSSKHIELAHIGVIQTPAATHLRFRVVK